MTNERFKQLMTLLSEQYGRNVSPLMAQAYWQVLRDFTDEQVEQAVMDYIGDPEQCNFWPQPGAIKAKITGTDKQQQTAITDVAQEQWILVLEKIRKQGAYGQVVFDDKVTLKAIQLMGGWRELCHTNEDKMEWRRKEFLETYRNSVNADNLPESIAGIGAKEQSKLESKQQLERLHDGINQHAVND
jgi:hypothetical protein